MTDNEKYLAFKKMLEETKKELDAKPKPKKWKSFILGMHCHDCKWIEREFLMASPWKYMLKQPNMFITIMKLMYKYRWYKAGDYGVCPVCGSEDIHVD